MNQPKHTVAVAALLLWTAISGTLIAQVAPDLDLLTTYVTGTFSNADQARKAPHLDHHILQSQPIWKQEAGHWIYLSQAMANHPEQPYAQWVYQLVEVSKGKYELIAYALPEPERWIGTHERPRKANRFKPGQLRLMEGCVISMHFAEGRFKGNNLEPCTADHRGAAIVTSEWEIGAEKWMKWDQGWTAVGEHVWGPTQRGIAFIKE